MMGMFGFIPGDTGLRMDSSGLYKFMKYAVSGDDVMLVFHIPAQAFGIDIFPP